MNDKFDRHCKVVSSRIDPFFVIFVSWEWVTISVQNMMTLMYAECSRHIGFAVTRSIYSLF
jgi:hypothetical protein